MKFRIHEKGFTLIEALVAIVILSVGIMGIWGLHMNSIYSDSFSNRIMEATTIANQYAEQTKGQGYSNISTGTTSGTVNGIYRYRITNTQLSSMPNTIRITVAVGWMDRGSLPSDPDDCDHKVEVITFVTQTGSQQVTQ